MSTFTLKSIAQRGSLLVAAAGLLAATFAPAVFADALNPLTERSLLLSSSAPGWQDTDGSGYATDRPNPGAGGSVPGTYAPAGSGANGRKAGQTFSFRVSTDSAQENRAIKAFTLQYCTQAAGYCQAPGNNTGDARPATDTRLSNEDAFPLQKSDLDVNYPADTPSGPAFTVSIDGVDQSAGWVMNATNKEDDQHTGELSGKRNFITLTNTGTTFLPAANAKIEIKFNASETQYITNPGADEFFVKMNTFDSELTANHSPADTNANLIDGGVTVANVMTDSIHITTKVLETMSFSVGTTNPDAVQQATIGAHGTCDPITANSRIDLGNVNAENSLETNKGYGANSFWRLSSNSSGGATVYYSGETLANTVGDIITPAGGATPGVKSISTPGSEQFGLAFDSWDYTPGNDISQSFKDQSDANASSNTYSNPNLNRLSMRPAYDAGSGELGVIGQTGAITPTASFAFNRASLTNPVAIADNLLAGGVLSCETGKMRYVANIAADTPAGVYTTKINYLAAPQY